MSGKNYISRLINIEHVINVVLYMNVILFLVLIIMMIKLAHIKHMADQLNATVNNMSFPGPVQYGSDLDNVYGYYFHVLVNPGGAIQMNEEV